MGKKCLDFPLTSRVLFAVLYLSLAVLCPPGWIISFDREESGLDMDVVAVFCLYLPLLPLGEVEHCWEQIVASDVREIWSNLVAPFLATITVLLCATSNKASNVLPA